MVRHTSERGSEQRGDLAAAGPPLPQFAQTGANIDRGSNQIGVRAYNERLVLALVRRHGAMARVDIARKTGLSAQTISVIIRELEKDGLITQGERVRGRVGQPSMPMRLAADGVFSFGLKIGRRSAEIILMDFLGQIRQRRHITYAWPVPDKIRTFAFDSIDEFTAALDADKRDRIAGLGIALPFELWNWVEEVGAPAADMNAWLDADLINDFGSSLPFPVFLQNDGTAACGAELTFGRGPEFTDFVYFSIGSFIGGGVVLNNTLYPGRTGNAGALGSMPMRMREADDKREASQLIDTASLFVLERMLRERNISSEDLWLSPEQWPDFGPSLDEWIALAARGLAHAAVAATTVIDFPAAIIDGWLPTDIRQKIVEATKIELRRMDLQGISAPEILEGKVGVHGKAMGAASLPLSHRYLFDQRAVLL
ncbi:ROK family transcriptional regulator [Brucella pseudogrignonensis]|uniref:NBD/HSP70 family sugar kinase n=1 Tax=Brucella pseudogrignonensis TaxID=419475 RepID=A0ABU1MEY9_9HYPH|nr:ROK family transcriptional regulator [Brucella pseudogrignonensis]MDR6434375.1 putative NBD/HSP70 family sugar kinase [Brucella pseudogrignonensis]